MEKLFRQCRDERVPLGEFLVARDVVASEDLRAALFEHTVESLERLCSAGAQADWRQRSGPGYNSRFTFSTSEVLVRSAARGLSPRERQLASEVEEFLPTAFTGRDWGAAFLCPPDVSPLPVVAYGAHPDTTSDILRVGQWASSRLRAAAKIGDRGALVTATSRDFGVGGGDVFVAFRYGAVGLQQVIIAGCTSAQGPARILNRRSRVRIASG